MCSQTFGVAGIDRDGSMPEPTAVEWVKAMNRKAWLGRTDWRLPENTGCGGFDCKAKAGPLGELHYDALGLRKGTPVAAVPGTSLHGFRDLQPYLYWSCAAQGVPGPCKGQPEPNQEWSFSFGNGFQGTDLTKNDLYALVYPPGR